MMYVAWSVHMVVEISICWVEDVVVGFVVVIAICARGDDGEDISHWSFTCCRLFWELEVSLVWPIRMVVEFLICWVEDVVVGYVAVIAIAHLVMTMMTMI